jgi:site-specific DNA-methyltransferase (adenine-specific)
MFASQPFTSALGASNIQNLKYSWVWEKSRPTGHLNAKHQPLTGFEDILVFYRGRATYNPQGIVSIDRKMKNSSSHLMRNRDNVTSTVSGGLRKEYTQTATGYPRGIISADSENNRVHPTQKPVALLEYLIKTYTLEGETVLDFTMGSGSTGVACRNLGRKFIGIEKDANYFEIAKNRIYPQEFKLSA